MYSSNPGLNARICRDHDAWLLKGLPDLEEEEVEEEEEEEQENTNQYFNVLKTQTKEI